MPRRRCRSVGFCHWPSGLPSRDRHDMLAKARICEIDPDMAEVSEGIALSIAADFVRLSALSAL